MQAVDILNCFHAAADIDLNTCPSIETDLNVYSMDVRTENGQTEASPLVQREEHVPIEVPDFSSNQNHQDYLMKSLDPGSTVVESFPVRKPLLLSTSNPFADQKDANKEDSCKEVKAPLQREEAAESDRTLCPTPMSSPPESAPNSVDARAVVEDTYGALVRDDALALDLDLDLQPGQEDSEAEGEGEGEREGEGEGEDWVEDYIALTQRSQSLSASRLQSRQTSSATTHCSLPLPLPLTLDQTYPLMELDLDPTRSIVADTYAVDFESDQEDLDDRMSKQGKELDMHVHTVEDTYFEGFVAHNVTFDGLIAPDEDSRSVVSSIHGMPGEESMCVLSSQSPVIPIITGGLHDKSSPAKGPVLRESGPAAEETDGSTSDAPSPCLNAPVRATRTVSFAEPFSKRRKAGQEGEEASSPSTGKRPSVRSEAAAAIASGRPPAAAVSSFDVVAAQLDEWSQEITAALFVARSRAAAKDRAALPPGSPSSEKDGEVDREVDSAEVTRLLEMETLPLLDRGTDTDNDTTRLLNYSSLTVKSGKVNNGRHADEGKSRSRAFEASEAAVVEVIPSEMLSHESRQCLRACAAAGPSALLEAIVIP